MNRRHFLAATAAATLPPGAAVAAARPGAKMAADGWDYVIIGAGAAGCTLAHRLSEAPEVRVLLIEAGGEVHDPAVDSPPAWPTLQGGPFDWGYRSTPQAGLGGRIVTQPRGKGLGGSTLINALGFQRGPREAYDRWAEQTGDSAWGYDGLLPYFQASGDRLSGRRRLSRRRRTVACAGRRRGAGP